MSFIDVIQFKWSHWLWLSKHYQIWVTERCQRCSPLQGERLVEEIPQMGSQFFNPKLVNLLTPLSLFGAKRYLHSLFVGKFSLSFQNHHVNRRLVLETCCEEINVKYFVKLQFCLEEVREIKRTHLDFSDLNLYKVSRGRFSVFVVEWSDEDFMICWKSLQTQCNHESVQNSTFSFFNI